MLLMGCGSKSVESMVSETTKESENEIMVNIANYELSVKGIRQLERVMGETIELQLGGKIEYKGYPEKMEIIKNENGILEVKALIKNDFFVTDIPVTISYEYGNGAIKKVKVEENVLVKPTEPFDMEMFYDEERNLKLEYTVKTDANNPLGYDLVVTEIPITKENIENIEFAFNVEFPNVSGVHPGGDTKGDFTSNTYILFTLKNGEKYLCRTKLYYKPYETLYDYEKNRKPPIWDIQLGSAKKVE